MDFESPKTLILRSTVQCMRSVFSKNYSHRRIAVASNDSKSHYQPLLPGYHRGQLRAGIDISIVERLSTKRAYKIYDTMCMVWLNFLMLSQKSPAAAPRATQDPADRTEIPLSEDVIPRTAVGRFLRLIRVWQNSLTFSAGECVIECFYLLEPSQMATAADYRRRGSGCWENRCASPATCSQSRPQNRPEFQNLRVQVGCVFECQLKYSEVYLVFL